MNKIYKITLMRFVAIILVLHQYFVAALEPDKNFKSSCIDLGEPPAILNNGALGYIQNFIDMQKYVSKCNDGLEQIDICLYNDQNSPSPCDLVTFLPNDVKTIGQISNNNTLKNDVSISQVNLIAVTENLSICIKMQTVYGLLPVVCKSTSAAVGVPDPGNLPAGCKKSSAACGGITASQSTFNFSSAAMQCIQDVVDNIFHDEYRCPNNPESYLIALKAFTSFKEALHLTVTALMTIYCILWGIEVILNQEQKFNLGEVLKKVLTLLLVMYFAIGLGPIKYLQNGASYQSNGTIEWALPILKAAMNDFTQMMFQAGGTRNLCVFDINSYPSGQKAFAIWDIIDCKIGAYFGVTSVYNMGDIEGSRMRLTNTTLPEVPSVFLNDGPDSLDITDTEEGVAIFGIIALLLGGSIFVGLTLGCFVLIYFATMLAFVSAYIVCIISMYILIYLSPLFVPMALFQYTKKFYSQWLKLVVSFALQPVVIGGFIAFMMTLYDDVFFGSNPGCQFAIREYNSHLSSSIIQTLSNSGYEMSGISGDMKYRNFEMMIPIVNPESCTKTMGYSLIKMLLGIGKDYRTNILFDVPYMTSDVAWTDCLILFVLGILMYYFSSLLFGLSAEVTSGVQLEGVAITPQAIVNGIIDTVVRVVKAIATNGQSEVDDAKKKAQEAGKDKDKSGGGGQRPKIGSDSGGDKPQIGGGSDTPQVGA
jgi:type IV secretion system protein VirB6